MKQALTDRAIKSAKHDISDSLVPGLILRVRDSGAKSYALVARFPGSPHPTRRTIAKVGAMTLADVRKKARDWLEQLSRGIDPADEKRRARAEAVDRRHNTLAAVAESYLARYVPNLRTADRITYYCRQVLIPLFGDRPIAELTWKEVSRALEVIEQVGTDHALVKLRARQTLHAPNGKPRPAPKSARNLFCYLDGLMRWAAGTGEYDGLQSSPFAHVSKEKRFGPAPRRNRYLNDAEIGAAWRSAGKLTTPHRQFYRMLMLTGLRLSEVREAKWDEFNLKAKEWTIPAERMKGRKQTAQAHVVPLTSHMIVVLRELQRGARGPFLFSLNGGERPIAKSMKAKGRLDAAMADDMGKGCDDFVNHDLRRTLRTRGRKLGIASDIGEAILAHRRVGVAGIYDHDDRLEERREAHELWGDFLVKLAGERKVVRLRKVA